MASIVFLFLPLCILPKHTRQLIPPNHASANEWDTGRAKGILPISGKYSSSEAQGSGPKNSCTFEEPLRASFYWGRNVCRVDEPDEY